MTISAAEKHAFHRTMTDLKSEMVRPIPNYTAIFTAINNMRPEVKRAKIEAILRIERDRFDGMTQAKATGVAMAMLSEMYTISDLREHLEPALRAALEG